MADKTCVYDKAGTYVAIVDMLGYTDGDGNIQYEPRGTEVELSADEAKRLSELDPANHVFPAIAKPDSHAALALSKPFSSQENPVEAAARLHAIHEVAAPLQTPAGEPTDVEPSEEAPPDANTRDYSTMKQKQLKAEVKARGIEAPKKAKNADLIALLQAHDAGTAEEGVTPRVGPTS